MVNVSTCNPNTIAGNWAGFSWQIFGILINPMAMIPLLLLIIGVPWIIKIRLRWKRRASGLGVLLLLAYLLILSPISIRLEEQLLVKALPIDNRANADAIVVLGRGQELRAERVTVAKQLWQAGRAPTVFVSGAGDAIEIDKLLRGQGIPERAVDGEPCSRTTEENARFTAALLKPRKVEKILLVTDPPHMLRSKLTFESLGFEVMPYVNPLPLHLDSKKKAFLVFREYLGIVGYGLQGRFLPRETPGIETVASS
jgi:uncharacterized SAM-binding protein YcdF (DUF218 family)